MNSNHDDLWGTFMVIFLIYCVAVFPVVSLVKKLEMCKGPVMKEGYYLHMVKNLGILLFLGGSLGMHLYWWNPFHPLGTIIGMILCLMGIYLGVIGKISEDFYRAIGKNKRFET
jgi:hypothetical protein